MALSSVFTCVCVRACVYVGVCVSQHQQHLGTAGHLCVGLPLSLSLFLTHSLSISLQYSSLYKTQEKKQIRYLARSVPWEHGFALYYVNFLFLQDLARSVRVQARSGSLLYTHFSVLSSIS